MVKAAATPRVSQSVYWFFYYDCIDRYALLWLSLNITCFLVLGQSWHGISHRAITWDAFMTWHWYLNLINRVILIRNFKNFTFEISQTDYIEVTVYYLKTNKEIFINLVKGWFRTTLAWFLELWLRISCFLLSVKCHVTLATAGYDLGDVRFCIFFLQFINMLSAIRQFIHRIMIIVSFFEMWTVNSAVYCLFIRICRTSNRLVMVDNDLRLFRVPAINVLHINGITQISQK